MDIYDSAPGSLGPRELPKNIRRNSRYVFRLSGTDGICFRVAAALKVVFRQRRDHRPARLRSPSYAMDGLWQARMAATKPPNCRQLYPRLRARLKYFR